MDGFIIERKESDGRVYRRGEMKLTEGEEVSKNDQVNDEVFLFVFFIIILDTKSVFLKFELEIYQLLAAQKRCVYSINFIQQYGNLFFFFFFQRIAC
jgi:hypothetical protein